MRSERVEYMRDLTHELAELAEQEGKELIAHLLRLAEAQVTEEIANTGVSFRVS